MLDIAMQPLEEETQKIPPPYTEEEKEVIKTRYCEVKERMKITGYELTLEDERDVVRFNRMNREVAFHVVQAAIKPKKEKKVKEPKEPGEVKARKPREKKLSKDELAKQKQQELLAELGF